MKRRWIIVTVLAVAGLGLLLFLYLTGNREQKALEETRLALRQQGFKIDLSEFNFTTSPELQNRANVLISAKDAARLLPAQYNFPLLTPVGSNAAIVVWKQEKLPTSYHADIWPNLEESLNENDALDAACEAVLSGPIRFKLNASPGRNMLLPHLAPIKSLATVLATRAIVALHDNNKDSAWTNLLAMTRLVTAWDVEPMDVSHMVQYACAETAFNATWQALQADGWSEDRLAALQREWESLDYFKGLSETTAFYRATVAAGLQADRLQPVTFGMSIGELTHSPRSACQDFISYWRLIRYLRHGSYEDEKNLLLQSRDYEIQLRRIAQGMTWSEISQLPGATNTAPIRMTSRLSPRMMLSQMAMLRAKNSRELDRMAEAETRRRLTLTAIALERHRGLHGSYPNTLQELDANILKSAPFDFMDGKPLRYKLMEDGHFLLFSVGLDCVDNGGKQMATAQRISLARRLGSVEEADLVWPRPASDAEITAQIETATRQKEEAMQAAVMRQAEIQKKDEMERKPVIEKLLIRPPQSTASDPDYQGRPLSKVLHNNAASGKTNVTLDDLLALKQIITGQEPETATFELPIRFELVTNNIELRLFVDSESEKDAAGRGQLQNCECATNGDCLLIWNTTYD